MNTTSNTIHHYKTLQTEKKRNSRVKEDWLIKNIKEKRMQRIKQEQMEVKY